MFGFLGTFFKTLGSAISTMWKKAPAVTVQAASAINYIVPFVESLDAIILPELAPVLNPILDKVKVGISALKVTVQDASPEGKTNAAAIISSIDQHLDELVSAAQVKNADTAAKIKAVATLVSGELAAISGS